MVSNLTVRILSSCVVFARRVFLLITQPYQTMRKISFSYDTNQLAIILLFCFCYFLFSSQIRGNALYGVVLFFFFLLLLIGTTQFFYWFGKQFEVGISYRVVLFTYCYTLIPTLFWFLTNAILYVILPPPRTVSLLGKGFSLVYTTYSVSLLIWKVLLVYFSIRFSARLGVYRIIYLMILYLLMLVPISVLMYQLRIFRIPFI